MFSHKACWTNNLRNFDLEDVHVEGAERIAEAVAKYDVDRFIHVSSYNANINSPSEFFATKVGSVADEECRKYCLYRFRDEVRLLFAASSQRLLLLDLLLSSASKIACFTSLLV